MRRLGTESSREIAEAEGFQSAVPAKAYPIAPVTGRISRAELTVGNLVAAGIDRTGSCIHSLVLDPSGVALMRMNEPIFNYIDKLQTRQTWKCW